MASTLAMRIAYFVFTVLFIIPRQLGVSTASFDVKTRLLYKSKFWQIHATIFALTFAISYPFAINSIISRLKAAAEGKVYMLIDIGNYGSTYVFCVIIYLRVLTSTDMLIKFSNKCIEIFGECRNLATDNKEKGFFILFIARVSYLYLGGAALNAVNLEMFGEDIATVPFAFKMIYFIPDLVMATTMIRFRSAISLFTRCCRQINQALVECTALLETSEGKLEKDRIEIILRAKRNFDHIAEIHAKLFNLIRETEILAGNVLIFSILKAFAHLSSTVNSMLTLFFIWIFQSKSSCVLQLFFVIDNLRHNSISSWGLHFTSILVTRIIFYTIDLFFTFSPASRLKAELNKTGKVIYSVALTKAPPDFKRSVNNFKVI